MKPVRWILCSSESNIFRLGKQPHRLPNIFAKVITDVRLDETSPSYRLVERIQNMNKEIINELRIKTIAERADAASRVPWVPSIEGRDHTSGSSCVVTADVAIDFDGATDNDIEFIAHARQDVPYLVSELRRLASLLEKK